MCAPVSTVRYLEDMTDSVHCTGDVIRWQEDISHSSYSRTLVLPYSRTPVLSYSRTLVLRVREKSAGPTGSADVSSVPASASVGRPSPQGQRVAARPALIPSDTGADETSALPVAAGADETSALPGLFTDPALVLRALATASGLLYTTGYIGHVS